MFGAMLYAQVPSPVGPLLLVGDGEALCGLFMASPHAPRIATGWRAAPNAFVDARQQLKEYFAGERCLFELSLRPAGTEFELRAWQALREIPYGETRTYGEQAAHIGHPRAARAVGAANGRNPISIIVPCHRLIGARGDLRGYGGGLERKRFLLAHEARAQVSPGAA